MTEELVYEITRFKKEKIFFFLIILMLVSVYYSIQSVKSYYYFSENIVKPFLKVEAGNYENMINYELYTIKGIRILKIPPAASVSVASNGYNFSTISKINAISDSRFVCREIKNTNFEIPFPLILILFAVFYGVSIIFSEKRKIKVIISRLVVLMCISLFTISSQVMTLLFVPSTSNDIKAALFYWGMVTILIAISFLSGVIFRINNFKKHTAILLFIIGTILLHLLISVIAPLKEYSDESIQANKFYKMLAYQLEEDQELAGLKGKEEIRNKRLAIVKKYLNEVYPESLKVEEEYNKTNEKLQKKRFDYSIISPLTYITDFRDIIVNGSMFEYVRRMMNLEQKFLSYTWLKQYMGLSHDVRRFDQGRGNIYQTEAMLPENILRVFSLYLAFGLILWLWIRVKLKAKATIEKKIFQEPGFYYYANLSEEERAGYITSFLNVEVYCIAKDPVGNYPVELELADIFSIKDKDLLKLSEHIDGRIFKTKIKYLSSHNFEIGILALALLKYNCIVVDNIAANYSQKIKKQFTDLIISMRGDDQTVIYLSSTYYTPNLPPPPFQGETTNTFITGNLI